MIQKLVLFCISLFTLVACSTYDATRLEVRPQVTTISNQQPYLPILDDNAPQPIAKSNYDCDTGFISAFNTIDCDSFRNGQEPIQQTGNDYSDYGSSYRSAYSGTYSYRPKTVHVRSYTRKDGTYVRSHYRSAPRRK